MSLWNGRGLAGITYGVNEGNLYVIAYTIIILLASSIFYKQGQQDSDLKAIEFLLIEFETTRFLS